MIPLVFSKLLLCILVLLLRKKELSELHDLGGQIPAHGAVLAFVEVPSGLFYPMITFHFDCVARGARNRISTDDLLHIVECRGLVDRNRCVVDSSRCRALRSSAVGAAAADGGFNIHR